MISKLLFYIFLSFSSANPKSSLVQVGVGWELCDLGKFQQMEFLKEFLPDKVNDFLTGEFEFEKNPLYNLLSQKYYYAPKAKLYANLQPSLIPCETFISNGKETSCEHKKLPEGDLELFDFEQAVQDKPTVILYSTLESSSLKSWIRRLTADKVSFVFRPIIFTHGCRNSVEWLDLTGTCITEFEAKSTEYSKKNKSKAKKLTLPPELQHLKTKDLSIDYSMELSSISEIALKMTQLAIDSKDPMKAIETIVRNYPVLQKSINSQVKLRKEIVQSVEKLQKTFNSQLNHIRINGFDLNGDVLDYYRLLNLLADIEKFNSQVDITPQSLSKIIQKRSQAGEKILYDLDMSTTVFLNNIEADPQYARWTRSFSGLLMNSYPPSPFKMVRRNMFTFVAFIPYSHPQLPEILSEMAKTVQQQVPLRLGFQLTSSAPEDDVQIKTFYRLNRTTNIQMALKFLSGFKQDKLDCSNALRRAGISSDCEEYVKDEVLPRYSKLFSKLMSWTNGKISIGDSMHEVLSPLGQRYQAEMANFMKAYQSGDLTDETDLKSFIFDPRKYTILTEYIPEVIDEELGSYDEIHDGLWVDSCPEAITECHPLEDDSKHIIFNGRRVLKNPNIDLETQINVLIKYDQARESSSNAKINSQIHKMEQRIKKELTPLLQASPLVVQSDWNTNIPRELVLTIGDEAQTVLQLDAVLNPASISFPRIYLLLSKFAELGFLSGRIVLNPSLKVIDYVYKNFYTLDGNPNDLIPPNALLSLKLDSPSSWITTLKQVSQSVDADNLRLEELKDDSLIVFELKHLIQEGQYIEKARANAGQGIQLQLEPITSNKLVRAFEKTVVMANYGYYQFKCQPNVYQLTNLLPKTDAYKGEERIIIIRSFSVPTLLIKENLPENWYSQLHKQNPPEESNQATQKYLNIFSIASGLPYERLLRIMMYSVSLQKKSDRKLKFWLFDSFVSPPFRDMIRKMSSLLKFEFEFVSYKWPTWLLPQKTKMRHVWAYKILFLDVIFPMRPEVDRVIFVDADQVARADLSELAEFDMDHQVYAFVPFCEDRPEMASYQFWNTPGSYWEKILQGKPYFIR